MSTFEDETGKFSDNEFKDKQSLHTKEFYISLGYIESFGELKND